MLRVVPLFETLDDLNYAETAMRQLFSNPWYKEHIQGQQVRGKEQETGSEAGASFSPSPGTRGISRASRCCQPG